MSEQGTEKEEISMCVEVVYAEKRIFGNIKKEIDNIAQKHKFDGIISIKFTG